MISEIYVPSFPITGALRIASGHWPENDHRRDPSVSIAYSLSPPTYIVPSDPIVGIDKPTSMVNLLGFMSYFQIR